MTKEEFKERYVKEMVSQTLMSEKEADDYFEATYGEDNKLLKEALEDTLYSPEDLVSEEIFAWAN